MIPLISFLWLLLWITHFHAEVLTTTIVQPEQKEELQEQQSIYHPREFRPFHQSNRSQIVIFVNTTEKRCFIQENLNVIFRYEFQEDIDYSNDLRLQLYDINHELLSETEYKYDRLNLISLPVQIFDHGVNVIHSTLYDATTNTKLDNQTTFFIQPCFPSPSALEFYILNPVVDHKAALLLSSGGVAVMGKFLFENFDQIKDQLQNFKFENLWNNQVKQDMEDPMLEHFRKFVNHKLVEANPNMEIRPPAPPALPPTPTKLLLPPTSSAPVIPPTIQKVTLPPTPTIQQQIHRDPVVKQKGRNEGGGMLQSILKNKVAWKVMGLVSGVILLSSASKLSLDDLPIPTRNIFSSEKSEKKPRKSFVLGSRLSFGALHHPSIIRDIKAFGRTLSYTKDKVLQQGNEPRLFERLDQSDSMANIPVRPKVQPPFQMWKSVAAVILQTGMILLQNTKHEPRNDYRNQREFQNDNIQW
jgi:hypothetical protein